MNDGVEQFMPSTFSMNINGEDIEAVLKEHHDKVVGRLQQVGQATESALRNADTPDVAHNKGGDHV